MKTGIMASDWVTTVSPTYSEEIQTPYYGHGLQNLLQQESAKLSGIINGIDYDAYNSETDTHLFKNYTLETFEDKVINKTELQKMLNLPVNPDVPMIAMVTRLVDHKGMDLVAAVLNDILYDDVQFVVLGTGDWRYEELIKNAAAQFPDKVSANITFNSDLAQKIYAGADIFLMPSQSEPCGLAQMISMRYGTIPVVRETGGLKDTVEPFIAWEGTGNGFTFAAYNAHDMLHVIRQAEETYRNKEQWKIVTSNAMKTDFSWNGPAREYLALYRKLTNKR
jgi:starch synthase